jgi:hypothetical protein
LRNFQLCFRIISSYFYCVTVVIIYIKILLDCDWLISVQLIPNSSAIFCNHSAIFCNHSAIFCNHSAIFCNHHLVQYFVITVQYFVITVQYFVITVQYFVITAQFSGEGPEVGVPILFPTWNFGKIPVPVGFLLEIPVRVIEIPVNKKSYLSVK